MKTSRSPGVFASPDDTAAALYLGHLAAQAEMALPGASREAQISLAWVMAHIASQQARVWVAKLEGISSEVGPIGSWKLLARTTSVRAPKITIERHATLIEDGKQIAALAHPFLTDGQTDNATESLLDFSVMTLSSHANPGKLKLRISDMDGLMVDISLKRVDQIKEKMHKFTHIFQRLIK